jgi:hypothetical protein
VTDADDARRQLEMLTLQLRILTEAVDRLTGRINAISVGRAPTETDPSDSVDSSDPFAWPSDVEIERYLEGRAPDDRP